MRFNRQIDDWRYVPVGHHMWILDKTDESYNETEDKLIQLLDDHSLHIESEDVEQLPLIDYIDQDLIKDIVYLHVYEDLSFRQIGKVYGFSRQYAHILYHRGIGIIKSKMRHNNYTTIT